MPGLEHQRHTAPAAGDAAHRADWDALAALDPYYAILSADDARFGGWDPQVFFASGSYEVGLLVATMARLGRPLDRGHALEVGCGAGRLLRHLAGHFATCTGVDVSPAMIDLATRANADRPNCAWLVANGVDLADVAAGSCDLVMSHLVLQHCPTRATMANLLSEMVRVCRPDGLVAAQLPTTMPLRNRLQPKRRAYRALRTLGVSDATLYRRLRLHPIRMNWLPDPAVRAAIARSGGVVLDVMDGWLGDGRSAAGERNVTYLVGKRPDA